jgi:hypothetical protein
VNHSNYISYSGMSASAYGVYGETLALTAEQERANRTELTALEGRADKLLTELNGLFSRGGSNSKEYLEKKVEFDATVARIYKLLNTVSEYIIDDYKAIEWCIDKLSKELWGYKGPDREIKEEEKRKAWDLYYKIKKALKIKEKPAGLKEVIQMAVIFSPLVLGAVTGYMSSSKRRKTSAAAGAAIGVVATIPMLAPIYVGAPVIPVLGIAAAVIGGASYGAAKVIG